MPLTDECRTDGGLTSRFNRMDLSDFDFTGGHAAEEVCYGPLPHCVQETMQCNPGM